MLLFSKLSFLVQATNPRERECLTYCAHSSDLFDIPATLRTMLEGLLAEEPSPAVLARYNPRVRETLFRLLRGLQAKQAPYWAAVARARENRRLSGIES